MTKKILVVEDEETILELIGEIFSNIGDYIVLIARDGEEALRIAREDNPDIILLDIQLPKISGQELCKTMKSDPAMSHIKVLIISGGLQSSNLQKLQEGGADAFINKPFNYSALVEKIEELLRST